MQLQWEARRLAENELPNAAFLYREAGRDAAWATPETLFAAESWGAFLGRQLLLCAALAQCAQSLSMTDAMLKTGLARPAAQLLLPCACNPVAESYLPEFLEILCARAAQRAGGDAPLFALLPVKTGTHLLAGYFSAGFVLRAMRPMFELRAHYVFCPRSQNPASTANATAPATTPEANAQGVQTLEKESIMIAAEDTLRLSRLLACGYTGTGLYGGKLRLIKEDSSA